MLEITRRNAIGTLGATVATSFLGGCLTRPADGFCPNDPRFTDSTTPLTIDAHTHVFNGSDLQINAFLQYIILENYPQLRGLGPVLQELGWELAPDAASELAALARLRAVTGSCPSDAVNKVYASDRDAAYRNGVLSIRNARGRASAGLRAHGKALEPAVEQAIDSLPDTYEEYLDQRRRLPKIPANITPDGALAFILRNFQYRYVNVFDYLSAYSTGKQRKIDLIVNHLVDFDWPIGGGGPTRTPLRKQFDVMDKIAIATAGRVHSFVSFDPMKEAAFRIGLHTDSSLALVAEAIEQHSFIGVKLYPPMGFSPSGNAQYDPGFWNFPWSAQSLNVPHLGALMDKALSDLFDYCSGNNVPIMAHTARSNAPADLYYDKFLSPDSWRTIRAGLRVDFGHFGDTDEVPNGTSRAQAFTNLMTAGQGSQGELFYADSGYFADCLNNKTALTARLEQLFQVTAQKQGASLAQRLMYGTDWEMIVIEGQEVDNYLADFEDIFATLDGMGSFGANGRLSDSFFGTNAANFLDLHAAGPKHNRGRLNAFYAAHNVATPAWMPKVDAVPR